MTTPILPDYVAPFKPVPNVTPFTIRDGATMLKKLDNMKDYIQRVLIPWINENFADLADDFELQVNALILQVNAAIAEGQELTDEKLAAVDIAIADLTAYVDNAVDSIINSTIAVTDPVMLAVISNLASETRTLLNSLFARVHSVRNYQQLVDTVADITAENPFSAVIHVPAGVTITTEATVALPAFPHIELRTDGCIIGGGNFTIFTKNGEYSGTSATISEDIPANTRAVPVLGNAGFAANDDVFVASEDTNPRSTDKLGSMRVISELDVGEITLDVSLNRAMTTLNVARIHKINMGGSMAFTGNGTIMYADQTGSSTMISLRWIKKVTFGESMTFRNGGGTAIGLAHCIDVTSFATVRDFANVLNIAYGISLNGACRNVRIFGHISRVRHAVTTNPGPTGAGTIISFAGEPEGILMNPATMRIADKALDTHAPGWGIRMILNDSGGSGGGAHVRADNVTVEGNVDKAGGPAVQVGAGPYDVEPKIKQITGIGLMPPEGSGAISLSGPASVLDFPAIQIATAVPMFKILTAGIIVKSRPHTLIAARTTSWSVNNTTVLVADDTLKHEMDRQAGYIFSGQLITSSSAAADAKIQFAQPVDAVVYWGVSGPGAAVAGTNEATDNAGLEGNSELVIGGLGAGGSGAQRLVTRFQGTIFTGETSGTLQLMFAQNVATAVDTFIRRGSFLRLERFI